MPGCLLTGSGATLTTLSTAAGVSACAARCRAISVPPVPCLVRTYTKLISPTATSGITMARRSGERTPAVSANVLPRRDSEIRNRPSDDLLERGRGHRSSEDRPLRLVRHHGDEQARVAGGNEADERGGIRAARVLAIDDLVRGAGLAGEVIAGNRGPGGRAAVGEHAPEHVAQLGGGGLGDDPAPGGRREWLAGNRLHDVRRSQDAAVDDRGVGGGHLDQRHRFALSDR